MALFDADPLDRDALLHLLTPQTPQQGGGAVVRRPQIESESVLDSTPERYWKQFQKLIGADDPAQVMGIGGAMDVPGGGGPVGKALGKLLGQTERQMPSAVDQARQFLAQIRKSGFDVDTYDDQVGEWLLSDTSVSDAGRAVGRGSRRRADPAVAKALDALNALGLGEDDVAKLINEP